MVADVVVVEAVEEEVAAVAVDAVGLDVVVAGDDALGTCERQNSAGAFLRIEYPW